MGKRTGCGMVAGLIIGSFARAAELPAVACDVVVVGGGSAGICAAIQSARAGAKTVLIEAAHQVGGNTTTGGVNFPGLFHAWGRQVIAGAGWDV
ncbi:MAG: FAD-dependent oxidoreductase, partial [Lentisphaerae bacterium]|nr:FAD-dependent oxidoreductase [Lentisphaerota bacterium]